MKTFRRNLAITGLLLGLFCAAATAGGTLATATVDVKLTILPYAQFTFDSTSVQVKENSPGTVTGTVTCNASVTFTAVIDAPNGTGTWTVTPETTGTTPGVHSLPWTVAVTGGTGSWRTVYFIRGGIDPVPVHQPSDGVVTVTFTVMPG